jgi:hypothetical protein
LQAVLVGKGPELANERGDERAMPLAARPALREPLPLPAGGAGGAGGAGRTAARVETPTQCTSASRAFSTGGGTRRIQLVRGEGRDVSS